MIERTTDPNLRTTFEAMLDCPISTKRGCRSFTNYILGALIKSGIQDQYDMEAAFGYVIEKMLMPTGDTRTTVFTGFDPSRPYEPGSNPLQFRFLSYLKFAVNNIRKGKIPRLAQVERRPQGTVSIGQGRYKEGDPVNGVSPDEIAAKPSSEAAFEEIVADLVGQLGQKERAYGLPLVAIFRAMLGGQRSESLRKSSATEQPGPRSRSSSRQSRSLPEARKTTL